ncbi:MAG: PAS domain S-box protein [Methanoregula sp.]|nr:PAS domain S-box protein [Methanoregula sp.]
MKHILYVDDEPDLLEIGKLFLESEGEFSVDTSPSATGALDLLKSVQYDAIVSDYQMPKMDGITFLKALRASGNTTPFIVFTGRGREEVVIEALNSGADFYLQKGGDPEPQFTELAHKIHHAISRKQADQAREKSERDYRHVIEHASEAIFVIQDELLRMINPQAAELSGYPERELLNQPFTRFVHPDVRSLLLDKFRNRIAGSTVPAHYTFRIIRKDGTIRWVELNVVAITWDERPAILNFMTDITDRKLTEDALRESEERYRQFFRTTLDCVFITTPEGRYIDFNDALMETLGSRSREETFAIDVASTYADPEERVTFLEHVKQEGFIKERPLRFRKRDGTIFDALISIVCLKNTDGAPKAFIGTVRDITDTKRTEAALRESEERYRRIFESFEDLYYQTDINGLVTILSPSLHRLTGYTQEEVIGKPVTNIYVNPDERGDLLNELAKCGHVGDYEVMLRKRDGTQTPVSLSATRIYDADGNPAGVAGSLRNITDRKQSEKALRESEEKFRSLVEYALEAILILDFQGTILFANNAATKTTETNSCQELIGRNVMEFIAPESREDVMHDFMQVAQGHDAYVAHYHVITNLGKKIDVESIGKVITYEGKTADLISLRDVTDRTRAEAALREANKKLNLLSSITRHDIKNQIMVLKGYLTLLEKRQTDPALSDYFHKTSATAQRISSMIEFTREYEEIGAKAAAWHDARTLVEAVTKQAPLGQIVVRNDIPPGTEVFADPLIAKVIYNLMDNAVRFGEKITTIRFSLQERNGDRIVVCEDDGVGIPGEEKKMIFERGFGKNTGLGLAISREILSITGITIIENGKPGTGARFEMAVPEEGYRSSGSKRP